MVKRSREDFDSLSSNESQTSPEDSADLLPQDPVSRTRINETGSSKLLHIDTLSGEGPPDFEVMRCSLPPHARQTISFSSFEDYEVHYNKIHVNRCVECRKNFPTPHFLDLHISENHNPLVGVLKDRGERTYACFVEDCDRKCSTPQKRRMHLIDKHMFPKDYDFFIIDNGIDQRTSMLKSRRHRRRSSLAQQRSSIEDRAGRRTSSVDNILSEHDSDGNPVVSIETNSARSDGPPILEVAITKNQPADVEMDDLAGAMSALKFVPPNVRFGRGKGKGGFSRS